MKRFVFFSVVFLFSISRVELLAQHVHQVESSHGINMLAGGVNGADNPESISDTTAYRLFFRALTSDHNLARQAALLNNANLSGSDLQSARSLGKNFESLRSQFIAQVQAVNNSTVASSASARMGLIAQREAIGATMQSLAISGLSKDGYQKLNSFIQAEKRKMISSPEPSMTSPGGAK